MPSAKISFSQYQIWKGCPHRWKLKYLDGIVINSPGIALVFGTAMHEVLQEYLEVLYSTSVNEANQIVLEDLLKKRMQENYKKMLLENENNHFSNKDEMAEYLADGIDILRWFKANRDSFFMKKGWELVGIELPINVIPVESNQNVSLVGFLDLVMRNTTTGKIHIYDFKTSTNGWGKYAKGDRVKVSQLVLYKTFYAKHYGVSPDDIAIEYLILKRKINKDAEYAVMKRRIQRFEPPNGKVSQNQVLREITSFINTVFDSDGNKRTDVFYAPIAGPTGNNCRFCEFKNDEVLCPQKDRIKE